MSMIEVKTSELIGPALDWAVAQIDEVKTLMISPRKGEPKKPFALFGLLALSVGGEDQSSYAPSTCWHCGGPLIEKYAIDIGKERDNPAMWVGLHKDWTPETAMYGQTPLIAACRAIVAAKLGDTVSIPAELWMGEA